AFHRAAVVVAGGKEVGETIGQVVVRVSKVDEAGAGHLDGGYSRGVEWPIAEAGDEIFGDASRRAPQVPCQLHGGVRRQVAVVGIVGLLELRRKIAGDAVNFSEDGGQLSSEVFVHG